MSVLFVRNVDIQITFAIEEKICLQRKNGFFHCRLFTCSRRLFVCSITFIILLNPTVLASDTKFGSGTLYLEWANNFLRYIFSLCIRFMLEILDFFSVIKNTLEGLVKGGNKGKKIEWVLFL